MGQFEFIAWLYYWLAQAQDAEFEWDKGNAVKNVVKHGVTAIEVESVFQLSLGIPLGRQVSPPVEEERLCIVGPAITGKLVSVVFTIRSGRIRPISARAASRKERKLYETLRKKT